MDKDSYLEMTDEKLAGLVQKGDGEIFGYLMTRYQPKLFRYGRKFLSDLDGIDDVVQDVFIKVYENIQSFDLSQKFSPWIYRIAHNAYVDRLKKQSRLPISLPDFDTLLSHTAAEDPVRQEKEREEIKKIVDKGLEKLSPNYREIIILYYLEEMDYKSIAQILRIPIGTVGIRLKRGKEALKKIYDSLNIDINEHGK